MEVSLENSSLLKIIQNAHKALSNKSTLPVLNGIFLQTEKDNISAYSTDLEIAIKDKTKANVKSEGKAVVFGSLLLDIVKNLAEGKTTMSLNKDKNKLFIKSGNVEFKLNTISSEEYPPFPQINKGKKISIKGEKITESIRQALSSVSRDETRPILTGVLFELKEGGVRIISTDSYRLSLKEIQKKDSGEEIKSFIVPRRGVEEILKIVEKEEVVDFYFSEKQVALKNKMLVFTSRLMGGQYPNTDQLFPKERKIRISIGREELLRAVKRMSLVSPTTPVKLKIKDSEMVIENESSETGSARETLDIEKSEKEIDICFNSKYLIDGLEAISDQQVLLEMNDPSQPVLIKGKAAKDYTYLIMPVRLS